MKPAPFLVTVSETDMQREREVARKLRSTQWWKRKLSRGLCHYCGGRFPPRELTMDHLVPVIRSGKSTKGNVVPACKKCNNEKKHRLSIEMEGGQ